MRAHPSPRVAAANPGRHASTHPLACAILLIVPALVGIGRAGAASPPPWVAMDYGPFFSATIGSRIPGPTQASNLTHKAIAVNLGGPSRPNAAILFDTDLLRYSVGWTGGFVSLEGVAFDGAHWAHPWTDGPVTFATRVGPGWAQPGTRAFSDPRPEPYGPLPKTHAAWSGVHVHGSDVVFSYRVGDMTVLDRPGLEESGGSLYFTRTLELGPSTTEQVVRVLEEPGRLGIPLREPRGGETTDPSVAADGTGWWFQAPMVKRAAPTTPPPTEGGIGAWSFDGSGEAAWRDGSGAARALVPESARVVGEGRSGGGLSFEAGQRVGISRAEDLDFAVRDITVAAWIRTREDGGIFAKTSPGPEWVPGGTALFVRGGRLTFDVGWVGAVASSRGVTDGEWHHVALAWKAADGLATLYVDGEPDGTGRLKPGKRLEAHVAWLGFVATNFPASPWFRGTMDEVRLYGRTLDATEIAALAGPPPRDATAPAVAILGAPSEARWWVEGESGGARLVIPAHASPLRLQFVLWRAPETDMARHAAAIRGLPAPRALSPLTRPGPSRWAQVLETRGRLGDDAGPYAIDELVAPDTNPWQAWLRFSGIDFFRDGKRAAVSTWNGDVWIVSGVDDPSKGLTWKRIAAGLYQPLGLRVVDDEIFVLGRDQITRLQDRDGDGETDFYENFNNDARVGEHFHEFANDLKLGPDGDFYYVKCARHALPAAHSQHGSLIRVSRDGRTSEVVARGFRAVNGLGVGPRGELTTVDNQGHWMPANRINWVKPGGWYGNQWAWNPDQRTTYDEPLCWVHNFVDRSGGTHLWVPDERWGLAKDDLVTLSYGMGQAFLVLRDDVGGTMQGALTRLPMEFETGVMRGVFHPGNGHLYACGLYGWAGNRTKAGGLYRIRKTDKPLLVPNRLHVAGDGLVLGFTEPLDRTAATDPGNYDLKAWNYRWSAQYGSPDLRLDGSEGRDTWRVESATVSADGRTVFLAVPQLRPVMQIHLGFKLRGENGVSVENFVHGTIHRTGSDGGLASLGANPVRRAAETETRLHVESPGLRQSLFVGDDPAPRDVRGARLAAFQLPDGSDASPFLGRPSRVRWDGWIRVDLNESATFDIEGNGSVRLVVDGREVLATTTEPAGARRSPPVALRRGLNRLELDYVPPSNGDAELRVHWTASTHPREPIPPTVLVHDGSDGLLRRFAALRAGRELFAERQCAACHRPTKPWDDRSMPELASDAPALDGIGDRLHPGWIERWLTSPRTIRADARMPVLLHGAEAAVDARDIAAYLRGLREHRSGGNATTGSAEAGAKRYRELGCAGCHALPGEPSMEPESRHRLGGTRAKWRPAALAEYLAAPNRRHAWTRMPDFGLSATEAADLAAFLLEKSDVPAYAAADGGDARRGEERVARLGCLRCHAVQGATDAARAPQLTAIARADGLRGCLASNPKDRRNAPDHELDEAQRAALRQFLASEPDSNLRRDADVEFAERQFGALQCRACHARDNEVDRLTALEGTARTAAPADEEEAEGGSVHVGRPILTHAGEKLYAPWTQRLFAGTLGYKPRSDLQGRMPAYPAFAPRLAVGMAHQHGYGGGGAEPFVSDPALAETGRRLTLVEGGFGCVSCHGVGTRPALAGKDTATVNFAHVGDRLRPSYYWRYVQDPTRVMPGTMMPKFVGPEGKTSLDAVFEGDAKKQFEAVWHYLHSVRDQPTKP